MPEDAPAPVRAWPRLPDVVEEQAEDSRIPPSPFPFQRCPASSFTRSSFLLSAPCCCSPMASSGAREQAALSPARAYVSTWPRLDRSSRCDAAREQARARTSPPPHGRPRPTASRQSTTPGPRTPRRTAGERSACQDRVRPLPFSNLPRRPHLLLPWMRAACPKPRTDAMIATARLSRSPSVGTIRCPSG